MRVRLTAAAARDIHEARSWYSEQAPGLGERFAAALDVVFEHLSEQPRAFPVVHRAIRRAPVASSFSAYQVFYRVEDDSLLVLAVIHSSRHPRAWRSRR